MASVSVGPEQVVSVQRPIRVSLAPVAVALLAAALVYGTLAQGAFYSSRFRLVQLLVGLALIATFATRAPGRADLLRPPVLAAAVVSLSTFASSVAAGTPASALPTVGLLATVAAAAVIARRLGSEQRTAVVQAVLVAGMIVAATGWFGVAFRVEPLALTAQGLWRAASVLTYANAAAALLAACALVSIARELAQPGRARRLTTYVLLVGLGATMSRGGLFAVAIGALALAVMAGLRPMIATLGPTLVGAAVALGGLLPGTATTSSARPVLAIAAVGLGAVVVIAFERVRPALVVAAVSGAVIVVVAAGAQPLVDARLTPASQDRVDEWVASLRLASSSPLLGVGPGHFSLEYRAPDGSPRVAKYAHNEYLQVLAEQGLVGLIVVVGGLAFVGRAIVRARPRDGDPLWTGAVAALAALAVHSAFDFVWHVPLIPIVGGILVGVATADRVTEGNR